ncbi:MAG: AlpA family phage regulatory protein [Sphingomonadales bacterium]|nr:AlpA family phage regulatory protein [Sphingomonadales bacterium]MBK6490480.1 AlpA family phage regulatory protein [Sphingomonadales bacterium]MBK6719563.1 AlpA family phage regulatory protein [Sphingomonadales bacterium]MBK8273064.1 AlpA family phage regulatory protein [Sphingomonadales bacterium]MBK8859614.1 AlpA family phage regulatory protein [Sphingomonadales bacterium]
MHSRTEIESAQSSTNTLVRLSAILGDPKTGRLGLLPISRSHFYRLIGEHKLPAPIRLGPRTSAWRLSDIEAFIERLAPGREAD